MFDWYVIADTYKNQIQDGQMTFFGQLKKWLKEKHPIFFWRIKQLIQKI
jgi:membrane glycosyltransferase